MSSLPAVGVIDVTYVACSGIGPPTTAAEARPQRHTSARQNRELRKTHYDRLHEIETYLCCGDLPSRIDNKVTRQAFKRQAKHFSFVEGQLHKNSAGRRLRVLWGHELFRVLKEVHEGWGHYPKDQSKFRTKISERFFFPQISDMHKSRALQLEI
jgi:hypothetical protein